MSRFKRLLMGLALTAGLLAPVGPAVLHAATSPAVAQVASGPGCVNCW